MLPEHGAHVSAASNDGWTALHEALYNNDKHGLEIVRLLLDAGAELGESVTEVGWWGNGRLQRTHLIHAAGLSIVSIVDELLARGANLEATSSQGRTALRVAVELRRGDMACALLSRGADRNTRDKKGVTALDRARQLGLTEFLARCQTMDCEALLAFGR